MAKEINNLDEKANLRHHKISEKLTANATKMRKEFMTFEVAQNQYRTFSSKYVRANNTLAKAAEMQIKKFKENPSKETTPLPSVMLYISKLRYLDNVIDKAAEVIMNIEKKAAKCILKANEIIGDAKQSEKMNDTLENFHAELLEEVDKFIALTLKFKTLFASLKREFPDDYNKHATGKAKTEKLN